MPKFLPGLRDGAADFADEDRALCTGTGENVELLAFDPTAMQILLDPESVARGLRRVAGEIVERHGGAKNLLIVGIRRGGIGVAECIRAYVNELEGLDVPFGSVDITLYRDDAATALPSPKIGPSEIPMNLDGREVILVDDVLYTGRTVRAAIDALMDYGRPHSIELAVLVERGGRELPIQADYCVRRIELGNDKQVLVTGQKNELCAAVEDWATSVSEQP